MKKCICLLLCFALCLLSCTGCAMSGKDIDITVGQVLPGMTVGQIPVQVSYKGEAVQCRVQWSFYDGSTGDYRYLRAENTIPSGAMGCLDIYCMLPKGAQVDNAPIDMKNVPGGTFDGIRESGSAVKGKAEAWLRILYKFENTVPTADVVITVGEVTEGLPAGEIPVTVTVNGAAVDATPQWIVYAADGYAYLEPGDPIPAQYWGRVDVYYSLPEGMDSDHMTVKLIAPGGTDEGTGDLGYDENGCAAVWSHIGYGTEPEQVTQATTEATTAPTEPHQHSWVAVEALSKNPTCTQDGWEHRQCQCGESYQEPLYAWGHDYSYSQVTRWPTCTQDGSRTVSCVSCGDSYQEWLPANGHNYSQVEILQQATCTQSGIRRITCPGCGDFYDEYFPGSGHNWTAFQYDNNRTHSRTCSDCGAVEEGAHSFVDMFSSQCTVCQGYIIN